MARILVLNYRLEVHTRNVYGTLAARGHEIWHFPLMDPIDPSAPPMSNPNFHGMRPRCKKAVLTRSSLLKEQLFFTTDVSAFFGLLARRREIDLVISHGLFVAATPALQLATWALGIPFVAQVFCRPLQWELRRPYLIRKLRSSYFAHCDAVLAAGDASVPRYYGVPLQRVYRFDPFIDFRPDPGAKPSDKREGRIRLGFLGQLFHLKGLMDLLDAYKGLKRKYPTLELLLIGGSPAESGAASCEAALRKRIETEQIQDVSITGWVPRAEVASLLGTVDIFVFPSHGDTYPKAVMEAMAMGLPVTLSDACGSVGPLAEHGETALVFRARDAGDLEEKVQSMIEQPELRAALARAAQARILSHTKDDACEVYECMIEAVIARWACASRGV